MEETGLDGRVKCQRLAHGNWFMHWYYLIFGRLQRFAKILWGEPEIASTVAIVMITVIHMSLLTTIIIALRLFDLGFVKFEIREAFHSNFVAMIMVLYAGNWLLMHDERRASMASSISSAVEKNKPTIALLIDIGLFCVPISTIAIVSIVGSA